MPGWVTAGLRVAARVGEQGSRGARTERREQRSESREAKAERQEQTSKAERREQRGENREARAERQGRRCRVQVRERRDASLTPVVNEMRDFRLARSDKQREVIERLFLRASVFPAETQVLRCALSDNPKESRSE